MRRKTYAYNSVIIGLLCGLWAGAKFDSLAAAIAAFAVVTVICFVRIRALENILYSGAEKLTDAAVSAIERRVEEKKKTSQEEKDGE